MMAFIGVRISWEMLKRKEDLISLACFSRSSSISVRSRWAMSRWTLSTC